MHLVEELEIKLHNNPDNDTLADDLAAARDRLKNMHKIIAEGAAVRSRAKYYTDGEKPSRLFCSLEKINGAQKFIPSLKIEVREGNRTKIEEIKEQKEIEKEVRKFYDNKDTNIRLDTIEEFLEEDINSLPKLSDTEKDSMEGLLTIEEATKYLKKTRNNASPGSTGYSSEFYKFFWINIKHRFIDAANKSFADEKLPISQSQGVLTLLPIGQKDKTFLKNWRPITLLNSFYKLISGCMAERIKPNLQAIIHSDQKGFVPNRSMGEVIRTTYDTIEYAKSNNVSGLLLLIDFEKAFDSISFRYIICLLYTSDAAGE